MKQEKVKKCDWKIVAYWTVVALLCTVLVSLQFVFAAEKAETIWDRFSSIMRELRKKAHRCFDAIYKKGYMSKAEAYMWLSQKLSLPLSETHIGMFGNYYCEVVIRESNQFMENRIPTRRATG